MPLTLKRLIPGIFLVLLLPALAAPPSWWSAGDPPVIDPAAAVNNKGPASIGQTKHMAKSAIDALRPVLPTVADQIEVDIIGPGKIIPNWNPPANQADKDANHAPLLIGQLKAIADPYYTRLNAAAPAWLEAERILNGTNHPGSIFPWTTETTDDANKAIANIGQLKAVFSLRFENIPPVDSDGDGLPDEWEIAHFGNLYENADGDADGDYLTNIEEFQFGTDPTLPDTDGDGLLDFEEVYWYWAYYYETDPNNWDTDNDGLGDGDEIFNYYTDPTDTDTDGDGLDDGDEVTIYGTDPAYSDSDFDGLSDGDEINTYGTNPIVADTDGDGLSDGDEILIHMTDPLKPDSDSDGMPDGWEITYGLDPNDPADTDGDLDNDNLTNLEEFDNGSNPTLADTDGDGLDDGVEVNVHGTDPALADSDADGLNDAEEINTHGTNPLAKDTDGDGISDFNDAAPNENFQNFADGDGDGISDANDPDPNSSRGAPPVISASSSGAGQMVNVVAAKELNFHLRVSNPAGTLPTASQIKFFLDGVETEAALVDLGGGNFVIKWISALHAGYPEKIVQLATAKFTDIDGAVAWKNLSSIDVAEWEGMIASLRTGTEASIPGLKVISHSNGIKSGSSYVMSGRQSSAGWYRGPREVSFVDRSNGSSLLTAQITDGMRYPLFVISDAAGGALTLAETISISSGTVYRHHGFMLFNYSGSGFRWTFDPGGTCTSLGGQGSYLALPTRAESPTGNTAVRLDYLEGGEWKLATGSTLALYDEQRTARKIWTARHYPSNINWSGWDYQGQDLFAEVEAHITPHAAGTFEYPGLPLPSDCHTDSYTPARLLIGSGACHKIILKVGPDAAALSNGIGLWLRKGKYGDAVPQPGFNLTIEGDNGDLENLVVPEDGKITLAPDSPNWQRLTSPEGLSLFMSTDESVTDVHDLSLQLLKKREWYPEEALKINSLEILPVNVEIVEVATGALADNLRSSNVAPSMELNPISLADVNVDANSGEAIIEVSGTVDDALEDLTGETTIDSLYSSTGQSFAVGEGSFSGTVRVPLVSGDVRVELETGENAAGRKGMVAFTLLTDFVPLPPPSIDPLITVAQNDGFTVELSGAINVLVADNLNVFVQSGEALHFPAVLDVGAADTVVADLFGKRLSLVEDAVGSLRFTAQHVELGEVVLELEADDFANGELPPSAVAAISAQNVLGGATLAYRFAAYKEGHSSYQGLRMLSLVETAANSLVFRAVTPDFGAVEFAMGALSADDPLLVDTMNGNLSWTLPVNGSSQGELIETDVDNRVFASASEAGSGIQNSTKRDSMMIVSGVKAESSFFGGKEAIYRMRVSKVGDGADQTHVTFTDPDTGTTRQMALEQDSDTNWLRTKDFAVLDTDPANSTGSEQLLPGLSTQTVWTIKVGENDSVEGAKKKLGVKIRPNPTMAAKYEWEEGKFFSGPFWLWGDDLVFDANAQGTRDFLKEGDAKSEGIIEVKMDNSFDRLTVKVFQAKTNADGSLTKQDGNLVPDGDALYEANFDHPDKVKFNKLQAGVHRFWDGRVNRIKDGPKAIPTYQPQPPPVFREFPIIIREKVYFVEDFNAETDKLTLRAKDTGKIHENGSLANITKNLDEARRQLNDWKSEMLEKTAAHDWEQDAKEREDKHPYFLDPEFGDCFVQVTGEYTEDGKKVPLVEDMVVRAHSKKYFVYLESDQKFNPDPESPFQLASDVVSYQWAGLLEPDVLDKSTRKPEPNSSAGEVKTSRHKALLNEAITEHTTAVVGLQEKDGWKFYDVFKRLTQRGELVIMSHGNTNIISLEHNKVRGFAPHEPGTEPDFGAFNYPLPKLGLNTATVGLLSCHSGEEESGGSLAGKVLEILDAGKAGLQRHNRVDAFSDVCTAGHGGYDFDFNPYRLENWEPVERYREAHGYFASTVDGWNSEIAKSGVNPASPADYTPYTGVTKEKLTERWTMAIQKKNPNYDPKDENSNYYIPASVKPEEDVKVGQYRGGREYYFTLPFPAAGKTQVAEIWEAPMEPEVGNPYGVFKKEITYTGLANNVGLTGISGITEEIVPAAGNVLLLRLKMPNEDGTLSPRGGTVLFKRYALQKYKIEEGLPPQESGAPGGDRLKRLREIHAKIDIGGGKNAAKYSTIRNFALPLKYEYDDDKYNPLNMNHIVLTSPSP